MDLIHPAKRLRAFRVRLNLSVREAARQLHVKHPSLRDWEDEIQTPTQPYRDAIEVWTSGEIKASEWPLGARERDIVANAGLVEPARAADSGPAIVDVENKKTDAA